MNKQKTMGIAVLVTLALLLVTTGAVFAIGLTQSGSPWSAEDEDYGYGEYWGPMHGRRGTWSSDEPLMHDAMVQAVADVTGLSIDEIESRISAGEHLFEIAQDAGMDPDDVFELVQETRAAFLADALDAGLITEEHYQWTLERMEDDEYGPGYGGCHRFDGDNQPAGRDGFGMGRRGRW